MSGSVYRSSDRYFRSNSTSRRRTRIGFPTNIQTVGTGCSSNIPDAHSTYNCQQSYNFETRYAGG
ncbi:hypothetical protein DPMN_020725 [Dreissena polymorpha]|uniref:Uncharacterized protein n=1 Tax=Dreissena polymorpha TaxID=45954 RepID=A0A9D4SAH0_DREPO|nr:hypothetical protein DPMN_020725 [Dreissena polymorpha]